MGLTEVVICGNSIGGGIVQNEKDELPGLSLDASQWETVHTAAESKHVRMRQNKEGSEMPNNLVGPGNICIIKRSMVKLLKIFCLAKTGIHDTDSASWTAGRGLILW